MRRLLIPVLLLALASSLAMAESAAWNPDQSHTDVNFSVLHMSLSNVRGHFGHVSGEIRFDPADIAKSSVNATIDVQGLDTGESARDAVLKSSSFFDVDKFPTATFTSTKVEKSSAGLAITGNLTLRGITRQVVLTADGPNGPIVGSDRKQHAGFSATVAINRKDFGIGASFPSSIVGDQVKISIDLEIVKQ
jgi:Uncharacterized conserved protein